MKVGDLIRCRKKLIGIVLEVDITEISQWARICWAHDNRVWETWEDMECSLDTGVFKIISKE